MSNKLGPFLVIASVGNPGTLYNGTRHNIGHLMTNLLSKQWGCGPFLVNKKWTNDGKFTIPLESKFLSDKCILFQTDCFMNISGKPVSKLWQRLKNDPTINEGYKPHLLILYDDLQIPIGKIQLRKPEVSLRGHKGLLSIKQYMGEDFWKLGVGIDRPTSRLSKDVAAYVLGKVPRKDMEYYEGQVLESVEQKIYDILEGKISI